MRARKMKKIYILPILKIKFNNILKIIDLFKINFTLNNFKFKYYFYFKNERSKNYKLDYYV
jgi:hypothetical protein